MQRSYALCEGSPLLLAGGQPGLARVTCCAGLVWAGLAAAVLLLPPPLPGP